MSGKDLISVAASLSDDWWESNGFDAPPQTIDHDTAVYCTNDGLEWIEFSSIEIAYFLGVQLPEYFGLLAWGLLLGGLPAYFIWQYLDRRENESCRSTVTRADQAREKAIP